MLRSRFSRVLVGAIYLLGGTSWAATDVEMAYPGPGIYGESLISTNYVERGLTQSESSPVVQATAGYQWTQGRIGAWASNVSFRDSRDSFLLRPFAMYLIPLSENATLTARVDYAKYLSDGNRDGFWWNLDINMFTYHVKYDKVENWEATGSASGRFAFAKEFAVAGFWSVGLDIGYSTVESEDYENYFDARANLIYTWENFRAEIVGTYASNKANFGGRSGPFAFALAKVAF